MRRVASIFTVFMLATVELRAEEDLLQVLDEQLPKAIPTMIPGSESSTELPPLLSPPNEPTIRSTNRKTCRTCPTDYNPNLAYLPDSNPDCRNGKCGKGCNSPETFWANADFFAGLGSDIRDVKHQGIYGFKLGIGTWLNTENTLGLDTNFFNAHDAYRDIFLGRFGPTLVDSPVTLTTVDVNLRQQLLTHGRYRLDGLAGYRYLSLGEQLLEISPVANNFWKTTNSVNIGQIGASGSYRFGPYTGELLVKMGFGRNNEINEVNGIRTSRNELAFVPELGVRVGYGMGEGARLVLGYNLIYLSDAIRPDNRNPPSYLLQGLTAGLEIRY